MIARQIVGECFALFCAAMLGLAAGAIWLLPTIYLQRPLPWLAVPVGWLLAIAVRQWVHGRRWHAAWLAAVATAIASVYVHVLISAVNISIMMGYGLIDAMRTAGWPMLLDFARISMRPVDIGWAIAGVIAAIIGALRMPRRVTRTVP
ncbi:hypothetical protein EO087_04900 [Dyella sp. M7H15-1]|uniref:hypothetical protein n=1 Tax=Dyella sp. M7H15-1 TaxID=2501295 RepID=UPI001004FE76|nr:hypothetical protein [Dyella sp. M7H15-1]QAU23399.1 hypothetical protein EO087_04900 [Dyella sp. M7H15-1]